MVGHSSLKAVILVRVQVPQQLCDRFGVRWVYSYFKSMYYFHHQTTTFLSVLPDIITAVSTAIVAGVAIYGITEWRRQLKGKTNYETARRYLKSALKLRDAMKYVRNPFIPVSEMQSALKENGFKEDEYNDNKKMNRSVYSVRWNKVRESWTNLEAELIEAEISWGPSAVKAQNSLDSCVRKLFASISLYLDGHGREFQDNIIYDTGEQNEFTKEITKAIEEIEVFLRPHLR